MEIDDALIQDVAKVARLSLTKEEIQTFKPQLKEILDFFSKIADAKVDEDPSFLPVDLKNVLREDNPAACLSQEDALKNTTHKKDGYFKGPKAV